MIRWLLLAFLFVAPAHAQDQATVVSSCGAVTLQAGTQHNRTIDMNGVTCSSGGGGSAPAGHRYWRLDMAATNGNDITSIAEIQFRTTTGVPLLFSGGTAIASSTYDNDVADYGPQFVTDNDTETRWSSEASSPQMWEYDYGAGRAFNIVEVGLQTRFDSGTSDHMPTIFTPQWSDDGANWTSMGQINTSWVDGQFQAFPVTAASGTSKLSPPDGRPPFQPKAGP